MKIERPHPQLSIVILAGFFAIASTFWHFHKNCGNHESPHPQLGHDPPQVAITTPLLILACQPIQAKVAR